MRRSGIVLAVVLMFFLWRMPCASAQTAPTPTTNQPADHSDKSVQEGCKLLPYTGTVPLTKLPNYFPDEPEVRGGMVCHYRISSDLPLFTFRFLGKPDNSLGDIVITEESSAKVVQTIENTNYAADLLERTPDDLLVMIDANFDGYADMQLYRTCGTGNCAYDFYLYDPLTGKFIRNDLLSDLCSPEFHDDTKEVTTHSHGSASDWENDTYQYKKGRYSLIRQEISAWDTKVDKILVNTYELRNGKMELVNSETDPQ
jgi:hypothetical protein